MLQTKQPPTSAPTLSFLADHCMCLLTASPHKTQTRFKIRSLPNKGLAGMQNLSQHKEFVPYHCARPSCNNINLPKSRPIAAASSNTFHQHLILYQLHLLAKKCTIYLWWFLSKSDYWMILCM